MVPELRSAHALNAVIDLARFAGGGNWIIQLPCGLAGFSQSSHERVSTLDGCTNRNLHYARIDTDFARASTKHSIRQLHATHAIGIYNFYQSCVRLCIIKLSLGEERLVHRIDPSHEDTEKGTGVSSIDNHAWFTCYVLDGLIVAWGNGWRKEGGRVVGDRKGPCAGVLYLHDILVFVHERDLCNLIRSRLQFDGRSSEQYLVKDIAVWMLNILTRVMTHAVEDEGLCEKKNGG